jgi:photosystem II stability/assembly factor-like uncharacterized protein
MNRFTWSISASLFALALLAAMNFAACNGSKWKLVNSATDPHTLEFLSLFFIDNNHGWAITPSQLLETIDGGKTWVVQPSAEDRTYYSLRFINQSTAFIVGTQRKGDQNAPLILKSDDSGRSWHETAIRLLSSEVDSKPRIYDVSFCNSQAGWAVGGDLILHTTDSGISWDVQRSGNPQEDLLTVGCLSPERAWVAGTEGRILQTKDAGESWIQQQSGTKPSLLRMHFFGNDGWIVGGEPGKSVLLRSRNGGETWDSKSINVPEGLMDIHVDGMRGWIVGTSGTILESNDGGETWTQQQSPTTNDLTCLFFLSPHQGWAGGGKRTLLQFAE